MGGDHVATENVGEQIKDIHNMDPREEAVFKQILLPDDSYDETGTYWGDMGIWRRIKFVNKVDSAEAVKELRAIGRMFKNDPLSPFGFYLKNMVIPGAGLLLEG
jgi:hypothetical protein